jgi:hypothetical protein
MSYITQQKDKKTRAQDSAVKHSKHYGFNDSICMAIYKGV